MTPLLNLGEVLATNARLFPGRIGASDLERAMTFREWNARACRLANALLGLGLAKGDRVAVLAYNCVEWLEIYAATAKAGLVNVNNRWCEVNWLTCESTAAENVHVIGDATQGAPGMPKSGHMANSQAKVCAAAVIARINGDAPNPNPIVNNTCYSFVSASEVVHVASVHQWDKDKKTIVPVKGAGGLSPARNRLEADYAWSWAQNIWADMLG